jgi:hypothetical protein
MDIKIKTEEVDPILSPGLVADVTTAPSAATARAAGIASQASGNAHVFTREESVRGASFASRTPEQWSAVEIDWGDESNCSCSSKWQRRDEDEFGEQKKSRKAFTITLSL